MVMTVTTLTHRRHRLTLNSTNKLLFRDSALGINSSADGQLDLFADTEIQLAATTVDLNGQLDVSGDLFVGGGLIDLKNEALCCKFCCESATLTHKH